MADLSVTAASVLPYVDSSVTNSTAAGNGGEAATAGMLVYKSASDGLYYKADCNASGKKTLAGILMNSVLAAGQPATVQSTGFVETGATTVTGTIYVLSATAGGICPAADLASGHDTSIFGVAANTTGRIKIMLGNSGIAW